MNTTKKRIIGDELIECINCGKMLPKDSFYKSKNGDLHSYCKECKSLMYKESLKKIGSSLKLDLDNNASGFSSNAVDRHLNTIARLLNRLGYYECLLSDDGLFDLDYLKRCVEKDKRIDSSVCVDKSSKSLCKNEDEKEKDKKDSPRIVDCIESVLSMLKAGKINIDISVGYS